MSVAMSPAGAHHLQDCPHGQNCRCPAAYVVNANSEHLGQTLQVGYASGTHYAQALPALDTTSTGLPNPSVYAGRYQAYTNQSAPLPFWTSQASALASAFDGPAAQTQALPAATANYYSQPTGAAQAYPSYTHNLNNSQWEAVSGPGTGAAAIQEAPLAVAPAAMVATAQSTRITAVPGEEGVYEIVIRVRL